MIMQPSRRQFLTGAAGLGAGSVLTACGLGGRSGASARPALLSPTSRAVLAAEARRYRTGRTVEAQLTAGPVSVDLAGTTVQTWAYGPSLASTVIRARPGDRLVTMLHNQLPAPTTIHWHGVNLRNDMDGVPGLTQTAVPPGGAFRYDFTVPDAGTYWLHSHQGLQLDRGLYGALVIEDPADPGRDVDEVLVLDDWLDGLGRTSDSEFAMLRQMSGMGGMGGMAMSGMTSPLLGGDAGDVAYPLHLMNGKPTRDPYVLRTKPGDLVRLRLINAGSDTAYRVTVGGHVLSVAASDGRPVVPVDVDAVLIGMGERYDVEFTAKSGTWPLVAAAEGKNGSVRGVLTTSDVIRVSPDNATVADPGGRVLGYGMLRPTDGQRLADRTPSRTYRVELAGSMTGYRWSLGGDAGRLDVAAGDRVRLVMRNTSGMWHPMHLHGHTVAFADSGLRKDTVRVLPGQTLAVDFDADNPGRWMYHCHNVYHQSAGMATTLGYLA